MDNAHWITVEKEWHWIPNLCHKETLYECSNCHKIQGKIVIDNKYKYCPHCGKPIKFKGDD